MSNYHFVLVPGHWLGGWAWDAVAADLRAAGHQVTAVTLPGLAPDAPDRAQVGWADQVTALAAAVDAAGPDPVLVAHSGGGSIASGVLDRAPGSVRRVIWVDSGPTSDGSVADPELPAEVTEIPLPDFDDLAAGGASLAGLSESDLTEFRSRAVPQPAQVMRDVVKLHDERRRDVPATLVACSIPVATVQELAAVGHPMFAEVAQCTDLGYAELATGHWPMFSRPRELAEVIMTVSQPPPIHPAG